MLKTNKKTTLNSNKTQLHKRTFTPTNILLYRHFHSFISHKSSIFLYRLRISVLSLLIIFISKDIAFGQDLTLLRKEIYSYTNIDSISNEDDKENIDKPITQLTYSRNLSYNKFIVPSILISYGVLTRLYEPLKSFDVSTHNGISSRINNKYKIDDYLQYTPITFVYTLDLMGIEAKHNFRERVIVGASSFLMMTTIVHTLKRTTKISRPDNSAKNSFPSGHTATAFAGAHILYREYKYQSPLIGISAYTIATTTGIFRMINKRHWLSDVITGAGVGILSVEIGYLLLPVFNKTETNSNNLTIIPTVYNRHFGIDLNYKF